MDVYKQSLPWGLQGKSYFKCWRLQLSYKQRFLHHHERVNLTAQIPYSLLMGLLCLLSSHKCQSKAPKAGRHLHSCLLAPLSHRSQRKCLVEGRIHENMHGEWQSAQSDIWPLDPPTADWHFSLIYFVILPFPSWSRNLVWFHQQMSVWPLILLGTRNSIHVLTAQLCHQVFREY